MGESILSPIVAAIRHQRSTRSTAGHSTAFSLSSPARRICCNG